MSAAEEGMSRDGVRGAQAQAVSPDLAEALARLEQVTGRLLGLERDVLDLQAFKRRAQEDIARARSAPAAVSPSAAPPSEELARARADLQRLKDELDETRKARDAARKDAELVHASEGEIAALRAELESLRVQAGEIHTDPGPVKKELEDVRRELETARSDAKKAALENERLEGELQSIRILQDDMRAKAQQASAQLAELKLDAKADAYVKALLAERDRLQNEKSKTDAEISRIKSEATKRFNQLKGDLEKAQKEHDTARLQKENLMRQLMARDAEGGGAAPREVTLEDITNSEVFKSMLGNIRRTSRQEVTALHDAIASLRGLDPKAYDLVLDVVRRQFQKVQIENPLAMLPRASTPA